MGSTRALLLIGNVHHVKDEWRSLCDQVTLLEYNTGNRQEFLANCKSGLYDSVYGIFQGFDSLKITGPFNKEMVAALPESLRFICHHGAGYDNLDVDACTRRNISISNTPKAVDNATADIAVFLMIGALRRISVPFMAIRDGQWRGKTKLGHDPQTKTLGILGMGGIGGKIATRALSFGMKVIYHNRRALPDTQSQGATYVSFADLLSQSDVLSLNLTLNTSTRHIIGAPELAQMKNNVVIINTSRGALINEAALVDALESGKVYAAGLDVYESEPNVHPGLLKSDKVVLLPHVGTATVESRVFLPTTSSRFFFSVNKLTIDKQTAMEKLVLANLRAAISGKRLVTQVPEQLQ
ncbi:D-3-phosphoglycerate dehydrogenase [Penicillium sp. IBT 16267x]|nr:D-3-phosphoglycerate dehydrogenase [Penicillium sp. IBT 16267x]